MLIGIISCSTTYWSLSHGQSFLTFSSLFCHLFVMFTSWYLYFICVQSVQCLSVYLPFHNSFPLFVSATQTLTSPVVVMLSVSSALVHITHKFSFSSQWSIMHYTCRLFSCFFSLSSLVLVYSIFFLPRQPLFSLQESLVFLKLLMSLFILWSCLFNYNTLGLKFCVWLSVCAVIISFPSRPNSDENNK